MTAPDSQFCEVGPHSIERICRSVVDGRRAARALADWARQFELTEPEFLALWCLRDVAADGVDQTTLAQRLALSPAQISATVERLRSHDWIVQQARPGDRRRHLWQLSTSGRTRLHTMLRQAGCISLETENNSAAAAAPKTSREAAA